MEVFPFMVVIEKQTNEQWNNLSYQLPESYLSSHVWGLLIALNWQIPTSHSPDTCLVEHPLKPKVTNPAGEHATLQADIFINFSLASNLSTCLSPQLKYCLWWQGCDVEMALITRKCLFWVKFCLVECVGWWGNGCFIHLMSLQHFCLAFFILHHHN